MIASSSISVNMSVDSSTDTAGGSPASRVATWDGSSWGTLGTGFGTALYHDGRLCPHLEISQQPFQKGETYDERLGNAARKQVGNRKWKKRVFAALVVA